MQSLKKRKSQKSSQSYLKTLSQIKGVVKFTFGSIIQFSERLVLLKRCRIRCNKSKEDKVCLTMKMSTLLKFFSPKDLLVATPLFKTDFLLCVQSSSDYSEVSKILPSN